MGFISENAIKRLVSNSKILFLSFNATTPIYMKLKASFLKELVLHFNLGCV
jgi:hypothetical protein